MIFFPNCKINLGLYIENKRIDGFHNIKTVFYPLPLYDVMEAIETNNKTQIEISGIVPDCDIESNLCIKAYNLLRKDFNLPAVKIHLHKAIPSGAGLGGGSADAAFTIKLLNDLFKLKMNDLQMQKYASILGSDCAFFIRNKAVIASGKGDEFQEINLSLNSYLIIVVKPPLQISTPDAYQWVKPRNAVIDIESKILQPIENWEKLLQNDFEETVFKKFPEIAAIREKLYNNGAVYASMSGSGASVFGLFKKTDIAIDFDKSFFVWKGIL